MHYAIALVPPTWEADHSLGFTQADYERWHTELTSGTRILVYKVAPVNAILAEGVVQDDVFIPLAEVPEENRSQLFTSDGQTADYALPLRITLVYEQRHYLSQEQLSEIAQATELETIIPVDAETYRRLRLPAEEGVNE